jgi:hypothetical protein
MKIAIGLTVGLIAASSAIAQDDDARAARSRQIAAGFQQELGARLAAALASGGPVEAIAVCKLEAPQIAARLSADSGVHVARTALRVRNAANAADTSARAVLVAFESELGVDATKVPERFETSADGAGRYMRAIVMQPLCLVCHGAELAPDVRAAVSRLYPADEATGFAVGDLRGAFVVEWPAPGADDGVAASEGVANPVETDTDPTARSDSASR